MRPITRFKRIIFGDVSDRDGDLGSRIQFLNKIDVYLYFKNTELYNNPTSELELEIDQNLQKYFLIQSNGEYLNVKLDRTSFDRGSKGQTEDHLSDIMHIKSNNSLKLYIGLETEMKNKLFSIEKNKLENDLVFYLGEDMNSFIQRELAISFFCAKDSKSNSIIFDELKFTKFILNKNYYKLSFCADNYDVYTKYDESRIWHILSIDKENIDSK